MEDFRQNFAMGWLNLTYAIDDCLSRRSKYVLNGISGQFNFGNLVALMGPSGAGKTTLLRCISMQNYYGLTVDSEVYFNQTMTLKSSFIRQNIEDHLVMGLTAKESLIFASKIKHGSQSMICKTSNSCQTGQSLMDLNSSERMQCQTFIDRLSRDYHQYRYTLSPSLDIIDYMLKELMLTDCANTIVKKCSGGEKKRIAIGQELLSKEKPNLMCIDEPTSGLDSNSADKVFLSYFYFQLNLKNFCYFRSFVVLSVLQNNT